MVAGREAERHHCSRWILLEIPEPPFILEPRLSHNHPSARALAKLAFSPSLTSKLFCIIPFPNQPRSPPFFALEQSLSVDAIFANSLGTSEGGSERR